MPFTYQNTYALFSLKSRLYQDAFIALAVWRQIISSVHYGSGAQLLFIEFFNIFQIMLFWSIILMITVAIQ